MAEPLHSRALVALKSRRRLGTLGAAIGVALAALGFFGLSVSVLHVGVAAEQMALFVAMVWSLVFVLDRLRSEIVGGASVLTESEKLHSQKMEAIGRLARTTRKSTRPRASDRTMVDTVQPKRLLRFRSRSAFSQPRGTR